MTDERIITLSPEIVERICNLNVRLTEAAKWLEERARQIWAVYFASGGREAHHLNDQCEDFELEAMVKCSLGSDDPAFDPEDEYANVISVVTDWAKGWCIHEERLKWSDCSTDLMFTEINGGLPLWGEDLPHINAFRQIPFCFLFHEVYGHALESTLDSLIKISEIEINLVLIRKRGVELDQALLPRKRKSSYPRSVRCRHTGNGDLVSYRDLRYARLLNQKLREAETWIKAQARYTEKKYLDDIEGLDRQFTEDNAYEDYKMRMTVCGVLGENHPEYDKDDDNIIVEYREPIYKNNQRIFGQPRNNFTFSHYIVYFSYFHKYWQRKINPCGLFWNIFKETSHDWLKMLSIGQFWLDVFFVQSRIINV